MKPDEPNGIDNKLMNQWHPALENAILSQRNHASGHQASGQDACIQWRRMF
jgi:hypothetical protein